jgi:hypothetical protein
MAISARPLEDEPHEEVDDAYVGNEVDLKQAPECLGDLVWVVTPGMFSCISDSFLLGI